jgi:DTW domain-containing protein YfiP
MDSIKPLSTVSEPEPSEPQPVPEAVPGAVIDNRVFVLVLQHPQEQREALATAPATVALLRRARLVAGLSWPNLSRALGRHADPRRWGVLYLGSARPNPLGEGREIIVLGRDGKPAADPAPILRSLEGIVLLDGSWKEAKTLWWRNPWLLKLHRLVVNPPHPARIGRLRREPRREALSTLEAAALVLRHLEAGPNAADALLATLDRLMEAARFPAQAERSA